jgi:hypothetical protein
MSDAANFPKSVQIDKPNQYQKTLFPFSAFSSDDPNVTANPFLTLASPWAFKGTFSGVGTALTNAISDTAANLTSSNPVLLKGQIGYETDTLSFKIGDGSTAYNSLTYFYRGLPVSGEPSFGTWHVHIEEIENSDPPDTNDHIVTVTNAPVGATMIAGIYTIVSGTAGHIGYIKDMVGNLWQVLKLAVGSSSYYQWFEVPLDSNKQFKWSVSNAGVTNISIEMRKYSL